MLVRSPYVEELMRKPAVFLLATQIAYRAKYSSAPSALGLQIGEALIGDFRSLGITRQQYRDAKIFLETHQKATFKRTNRGTVAKLSDSSIYEVFQDGKEPSKEPTENHLGTNGEPLTKKGIKEEGYRGVRDDVSEAWNSLGLPFPKIASITNGRRVSLNQRLSETFFVTNWRLALDRLKTSDFAKGKNDRQWIADFEFFLKPDTVAKILEGKYDNKTPIGRNINHPDFKPF